MGAHREKEDDRGLHRSHEQKSASWTMRNANTLPTQSHRFTSAKSNQAKLDEDRMDPEFGNLWKRGAEQTSGVYTTTELWNQQGLCWALTSLWPVL